MAAPLTPSGITFEQAGGAGLSTGLSLQGKAADFKDLWLEDKKQKRLQEEKAKEAKKAAFDKWNDMIDYKGIHNLDLPEAKEFFANWFNDLVNNVDKYSDVQKRQKIQEAKLKQVAYLNRKQDLEKKEAEMSKYSESPIYAKALAKMQGGNYSDLESLNNDPENRWGEFQYDPQTKTVGMQPIKPIDTAAYEKKFVSGLDKRKKEETDRYIDVNGVPKKEIVTNYSLPYSADEAKKIQDASGITEGVLPSAESSSVQVQQDLEYKRQKRKELYNSGRLQGYDKLSDPEKTAMLNKAVADDLYTQSGGRETTKILSGTKPKGDQERTFDGGYAAGGFSYKLGTVGENRVLSDNPEFANEQDKALPVIKIKKNTGKTESDITPMELPNSNHTGTVYAKPLFYYKDRKGEWWVYGKQAKEEVAADGNKYFVTLESEYRIPYEKAKTQLGSIESPDKAYSKIRGSKDGVTPVSEQKTKEPKVENTDVNSGKDNSKKEKLSFPEWRKQNPNGTFSEWQKQ